ncbi:hypothetical protein BGX27_005205 [Mortierella sp. AM989]|nr:hypothetical protein BGX27_005205 [Mortierella sp. AM989]
MVAIGDGAFKGKGGAPVKANKFISKLQSQAAGEGMLVCCVDEFRTSIFYCKCHTRMKTKGRSVICPDPSCGANAALQWVKEFKWPEALDRQLAKKQEAPCGMVQTHMDLKSI